MAAGKIKTHQTSRSSHDEFGTFVGPDGKKTNWKDLMTTNDAFRCETCAGVLIRGRFASEADES
jgi:hypothetical protein